LRQTLALSIICRPFALSVPLKYFMFAMWDILTRLSVQYYERRHSSTSNDIADRAYAAMHRKPAARLAFDTMLAT